MGVAGWGFWGFGKTMGKPLENHGKTMGNPWENGDLLMTIAGWCFGAMEFYDFPYRMSSQPTNSYFSEGLNPPSRGVLEWENITNFERLVFFCFFSGIEI
jgi:hypothetical protein